MRVAPVSFIERGDEVAREAVGRPKSLVKEQVTRVTAYGMGTKIGSLRARPPRAQLVLEALPGEVDREEQADRS